jgi:hypothetical protein
MRSVRKTPPSFRPVVVSSPNNTSYHLPGRRGNVSAPPRPVHLHAGTRRPGASHPCRAPDLGTQVPRLRRSPRRRRGCAGEEDSLTHDCVRGEIAGGEAREERVAEPESVAVEEPVSTPPRLSDGGRSRSSRDCYSDSLARLTSDRRPFACRMILPRIR